MQTSDGLLLLEHNATLEASTGLQLEHAQYIQIKKAQLLQTQLAALVVWIQALQLVDLLKWKCLQGSLKSH